MLLAEETAGKFTWERQTKRQNKELESTNATQKQDTQNYPQSLNMDTTKGTSFGNQEWLPKKQINKEED